MSPQETYRAEKKTSILKRLSQNKSFWVGLVLKLLLALLFASDYMTTLFAPFIKQALNGSFWNIYDVYYHIKPNAFPYPPVMLYVLALPRFIASSIWSTAGPVTMVDVFCLKLPLLIADIVISIILIKWLQHTKKVIKWYWLNPIIIYICYIHSQLDIIPTALFCVALYYLFNDRYKWFALFIVLACTTKFHIIITLPFILIYLYKIKKLEVKSLTRGIPAIILAIALLNMPFLLQSGFLEMVYNNREQSKVFTSYFSLFENYRMFFIPACYMVLLYLMAEFKFVNKDILILFLALGFGIFTFFLVPQPGWYLWNMPFFIYFLIRFNFRAKYLFILLNITYFIFFLLYAQSDVPQVAQLIAPSVKSMPNIFQWLERHHITGAYLLLQLSFTVLQVSLLIFLVSLFRLGVLQVRKYKTYNQPYLIGIGGDSGSGKSTLTKGITELFGAFTLVVRGDDMHRWERGHEKWNEITHLNPKANWLHRDLADLIELKAGNKIKRRSYDHNTGKFTPLQNIDPNKIVIYEGLHSFYLKEASNIYDLKVFLKPSENLRTHWKIERDVAKRGYAPEKVIEALQKRQSDSDAHILIQESEADIIFSVDRDPQMDIKDPNALFLRVSCSNDIFFEYLLDSLTAVKLDIHHDINRQGQEITIKGHITAQQVEDIAAAMQLDIKETIGCKPIWNKDYLGIMQLIVAYSIFAQLKRTGVIVDTDVNLI
jgi:uridine kinase